MAKLPATLGECADRLYELRGIKSAKKKEIEAIEEEEGMIRDHLINTLPADGATGVAGMIARVSINTKEKAQVCDWGEFCDHVRSTGDFDLMQRRLNEAAVKLRWEVGVTVPGTTKFVAKEVSCVKVKK